jgi:hypothetical protein
MSGGQRIDDHSSWIGAGPSGVVYPAGAKMKRMDSAEGAGAVTEYEDTSERIRAMQDANIRKAKAGKPESMYRN